MFLNLFVILPSPNPFSGLDPAGIVSLTLHMLLGFALLRVSVAMIWAARRASDPIGIRLSVVSTLGVFLGIFGGLAFVFNRQNAIFSFIMASGFIVALPPMVILWTKQSPLSSSSNSVETTAKMAEPKARMVIVAILEFLVGGIVVVGGSALVTFSVDALGKVLGAVHLVLGFAAFPVGYTLWTGKARARTLALAVNIATVAFSTVSEGILSGTGSLPSRAFFDSIIGTGIAVLLGLAVIYSVTQRGAATFLRKSTIQPFDELGQESPRNRNKGSI